MNGRKLIARDLASMGKIQGTLRISRLIDHRKCKSVITRQAQLAPRSVPLNCLGIISLNFGRARSWRRLLNLPALFALADFHVFSVVYAALSCSEVGSNCMSECTKSAPVAGSYFRSRTHILFGNRCWFERCPLLVRIPHCHGSIPPPASKDHAHTRI